MTREEAIKIIDCYDIGFYDLSGEKIPADKLANAFDMAIEALSADTVSRDVYDKRIKADEEIIDSYRKEFQKALSDDAVQGEWIMHGEPPWLVRECSKCGTKWHQWSGDKTPNYCSNCGVRMKGGENR